jgi:nucleoside triphosphate pyrophosphatase
MNPGTSKGRAPLILASGSVQRRGILEGLGVLFEVVVPGVEELGEGDPEEVVLENARRKARAVLPEAGPGQVVLAADTAVVLDGVFYGKPAGCDQARAHILALAGKTHEVLSGLVVLGPAGDEPVAERSGVERTLVTFRQADPAFLERYLDAGEWQGRSGAYAIQGLIAALVERIEGDLSNVVGLPVRLLSELAPELFQAP